MTNLQDFFFIGLFFQVVCFGAGVLLPILEGIAEDAGAKDTVYAVIAGEVDVRPAVGGRDIQIAQAPKGVVFCKRDGAA